ncbi:MAG: 30S ribosomal protein S18 [Patescibacteria group bacterium]
MPTYQNRKCQISKAGVQYIDYKNLQLLSKYISKYGRIVPRYYSGANLQNQKKIAQAIKRARHMALVPFVK